MQFAMLLERMMKFEGDPKAGPPPAMAGSPTETGTASGEAGVLMLSEADPKAGPPPTDEFYPERLRVAVNRLDPLRFGVAFGLAALILFAVITLLVWITGQVNVLGFLGLLFPGFAVHTLIGLFVGWIWTFVLGFLFGIFIALLYNALLREHIVLNEGWELFG